VIFTSDRGGIDSKEITVCDTPEKQRESQNIVVLGYLRAGP
jgi:hypothetical protein